MTNLTEMTPEALYELNRPMLAKKYARQELTADEQALHLAIIAEVSVRSAALRARELEENAARRARYQ